MPPVSLTQWCGGSGRHPCCADPCELLDQFNSANNEHNYVQMLSSRITHAMPDFAPRFVIDTGRNGVDSAIRQSCSNWCNIRGAGLGKQATARTALPALVDAYFWLKTPGESDGCTELLPDGTPCPRFDRMCAPSTRPSPLASRLSTRPACASPSDAPSIAVVSNRSIVESVPLFRRLPQPFHS